MSFLKKAPLNVFTVLIVAAGLNFAFRALNVVTFHNTGADAITATKAADAVPSNEEPPPLGKNDVQKSVNDTAKAVNNMSPDGSTPGTASADSGPDSIKPPASPASVAGAAATTAAKDGAAADAAAIDPKTALPPDTSNPDERSFSTSELDVLQSLAKRRDDLDKREQKIAAHEALLTAAEGEVDRKIAELNKLKSEIEALLGKQQDQQDARIDSLVKIYENMKPQEAATIFNTLDMDVLLSVISKMNERKVSPILAAMSPEKARIVTIKLAEQKKLPAIPPDIKKPAPSGATPSAPPAATP